MGLICVNRPHRAAERTLADSLPPTQIATRDSLASATNLVDLQPDLPDHRRPGFGLAADQIPEILGRAADQVEALRIHLRDDVGLLQYRVDLCIELRNHLLRRTRRNHDAVPGEGLETGIT